MTMNESPPIERKPFTAADLFLHRKVKSLHAVQAHDRVVCEVRAVDEDPDDYRTHLWSFDSRSGHGQQLTYSGQDRSPRLCPAAERVAFVSDRDGTAQMFCLPLSGGEARPIGDFEAGIGNFRWTPDGQAWIVSAAVEMASPHDGPWARLPPPRSDKLEVEVGWRLPYKEDGIGNVLSRQFHLFEVQVDGGERRQLTQGRFDVVAFDVSADGSAVAFARSREGRYAHSYDLWVLDLRTGQQRQLTDNHAMVMQPAWSPDGARIAFTGAVEEGDAEPRLWIVDVATTRVTEICRGQLDVADPETVRWTPDGRALQLLRAYRGRHQIVEVDAESHALTVLDARDRQLALLQRAGDRFVYVVEHPTLPSELWSCDAKGGDETRLSQLNAWWDERVPITATSREFEVPDGQGGTETIQGWLLRPTAVDGPTPLLDDVHGGPASYALLDFDTNVFWQVLCSQGWSVLALNAVGSASFGREFCQRLSGHWGELDLPQHLAAIDALQAEGVCDARVAISGKSYGGYFSCWAIGHTDRFKAAVVMAPVGNIETHYGTSDGGYYADPYYIATKPRFDREAARRLSPLQYVEQATTPTLFMQGKDDERCPKCQSEELFVSLYRAGETPAQLVLYPGESHGFLGEGAPACRNDAAERILAWIQHYADGGDGAA